MNQVSLDYELGNKLDVITQLLARVLEELQKLNSDADNTSEEGDDKKTSSAIR